MLNPAGKKDIEKPAAAGGTVIGFASTAHHYLGCRRLAVLCQAASPAWLRQLPPCLLQNSSHT